MATTSNDSILLSQIVNSGVNIYGSREKIRTALVEYAKTYLNLGDVDINKTSYLAYLIDMLSILSANHIFYDSTIYREFFFTDAQMTESVNNLAKWIGYTIPKATPAEVDLMFSIPLNFNYDNVNFSISPYFYARSGDIPFIIKSNALDSDTAANINLLSKNQLTNKDWVVKGSIINNSAINVRDNEGYYKPVYLSKKADTAFFMLPFVQKEIQLRVFQIPSDLAINQFYSIPVTFEGQVCDIEVYVVSPYPDQKLSIADSSIDGVLDAANFDPVNDEFADSSGNTCKWTKWTESVNGIYTMSSRALQFGWIGGYNKGEILFGNGILGKQPAAGSIVAVRLHVTQGSRGNVIANTINDGDAIYTTTANHDITSVGYSIRNTKSAHGGSDLLTLPEIKQNAITNLSAKKRLVSESDYDNIKTILGNDLPLNDSYAILKRSDIKVNEVDVFTTLNYITDEVNEIVPTRNVCIDLENPKWDDDGKFTLYRDYEVEYPANSGEKYLTMFNMTCDKNTMTASYDYILQNVYGSATKMYSKAQDNYWDRFVHITGNGCNFGIDINKNALLGNNYPLNVTFNVNHVASKINKRWISKIKEGQDSELTITDLIQEASDESSYKGHYSTLLVVNEFRASMTTKWGKFDVYQPTSTYGYKVNKTTEEEDDNHVKTTYISFGWKIDNYADVPDGTQRFEFTIQALTPKRNSSGEIIGIDGSVIIDSNDQIRSGAENTPIQFVWTTVNTYYCDIIIRRNLDNFMSSSLTTDDNLNYRIHNVPAIFQDYYNNIVNSEDNTQDSNNFELHVMQKLVSNLNLSDSRMLTDFVNIKFADTYGSLINLRYNKPDYIVESRYWHTPWWNGSKQVQDKTDMNAEYEASYSKPESERTTESDSFPDIMKWPATPEYPDGTTNEYYIDPAATIVYYIVNGVIPEEKRPLSEYIGHIALRVPHRQAEGKYTWTYNLYEPDVGTYVRVKDELDADGYYKTVVWTGKQWKDVTEYKIPLHIKLKVEVDTDKVSKNDEAITEEIIDTLTQYYQESGKMGLQRNLDKSEIIRVCRSVEGVIYAELLDPAIDIRFNYEMKDLTQKQLLDFTPQYVGFRGKSSNEETYNRTTISVTIIRK